MADTGVTSPGTAADDSSVGTITWVNPSNVTASDNNRSSISGSFLSSQSHYLKVTNFGFSIPSGTIDGVEIHIERYIEDGSISDAVVSLVVGGSITGDNKAGDNTWTSLVETTDTYGGSTDTWSVSLTPSDINSSNFGAVLSASLGSLALGYVDYMAITVYYTEASTGYSNIVTGVSSISKVDGVATANISKVIGI